MKELIKFLVKLKITITLCCAVSILLLNFLILRTNGFIYYHTWFCLNHPGMYFTLVIGLVSGLIFSLMFLIISTFRLVKSLKFGKMWKYLIGAIAVIANLLFLYISGITVWLSSTNNPAIILFLKDLPFDGQLWNAGESTMERRRFRMLPDLVKRNKLIGSTKKELIGLLSTGEDRYSLGTSGRDLIYPLGDEPGFMSIDYIWLVIIINEKDIATGYYLITD